MIIFLSCLHLKSAAAAPQNISLDISIATFNTVQVLFEV